jgi:hypothetical protein
MMAMTRLTLEITPIVENHDKTVSDRNQHRGSSACRRVVVVGVGQQESVRLDESPEESRQWVSVKSLEEFQTKRCGSGSGSSNTNTNKRYHGTRTRVRAAVRP